jgi:hypothetical protein
MPRSRGGGIYLIIYTPYLVSILHPLLSRSLTHPDCINKHLCCLKQWDTLPESIWREDDIFASFPESFSLAIGYPSIEYL